MAVFPADDNASKYERLSAWHDARKSAVCPSDLRPQTGDDLMDSQTLAGLFGPVGPLPELGTHQKKLIQFLQQFNDTPHERTVWEHFHELRGMSEDSFAMAECRAKAETDCRDVRDYMAKLILPEMQVFIKRQGIEPPLADADDSAERSPDQAVPSPADEWTLWLTMILKFAQHDLKGIQRRVVELLVEANGSMALPDIATDKAVGWQMPYKASVDSVKRQLNTKLSRLEARVSVRDNQLRLVPKAALNGSNGKQHK